MRIYVAGHRGLVGSAITRAIDTAGDHSWLGKTRSELDLLERKAVFEFLASEKPDAVIIAAAKVGGIHANNVYPADFLSENLQIQVNLIDAANEVNVDKFVFLGSSCIYPKFAAQPIREDSLLTGALEPTNDAYAIAKIAGVMQIQASRRQFDRHWISAMPTNLYGPGDNFHPENSHVLPGLMRRIHEAKLANDPEVVIWGSGKPLREFLFVDDLADAIIFLINHYDAPDPINVGVGADISIREVAELIAQVVGYQGILIQDTAKPDGTPRKLLDVSQLNLLGWKAKTGLKEGLEKTYSWYLNNSESLRVK
jgi:GDP-L-fucose synthase